jgi:hypothetical protein
MSDLEQEPVISIPDYRQMQSSSGYYPLLSLARILDHQMSRRYNRSLQLLLLDNSDRLPGFCCSDGLVAGVAPPTGLLISASDPGYISECLKSCSVDLQAKHLGEPR